MPFFLLLGMQQCAVPCRRYTGETLYLCVCVGGGGLNSDVGSVYSYTVQEFLGLEKVALLLNHVSGTYTRKIYLANLRMHCVCTVMAGRGQWMEFRYGLVSAK